jgi:hypothetical protein
VRQKLITLSLVFAIGGIGAGVGLSAGSPVSSVAQKQDVSSRLAAYKVNSHGETYGSGVNAATPSQFPDLIQVQATNGETGYVKKADLLGPVPTLQQVLGYARDSQGNFVSPPMPATLPVYSSNGTSQIGVFEVNGNEGSVNLNGGTTAGQ